MSYLETLRVALRALWRNRLRSFLTTLGVVIGVGAVIAMVALGEGAKAQVEANFSQMGTNLLIIMSGSASAGGSRGGFGTQPTLTWDDLKAIQSEVASVRTAAPQLRSSQPVIGDEQNWTSQIYGTTPAFFDLRSWNIAKGALFTTSDVDASAKVAVLGQTVVDNLYGPSADPVGQQIRIRNVPFVVIGVLEKKGQGANGQDNDDAVFIPVSTYQTKLVRTLQKYLAGVILVSAHAASGTAKAQQEITALLRERHHIQPPTDDDFFIRNLAEIASAQQASANTITSLLAAIALVSLLVGGIGVMNIMLVSVTERTREIGLRMAIGAKPLQILAQFLVEALSLSTIGGLIGIGGGVIAAMRISKAFGWPVLIQPEVILVSLGFSALVGIVFGLYPAYKASRLDPIEALRYE
jgi:putative ABC transport system permease protein